MRDVANMSARMSVRLRKPGNKQALGLKMTVLACEDFDEFCELLDGVDGRYLLTECSRRAWRLRMVELPNITVMAGHDGAPSLFQAACQAGVHGLFISLDATPLALNGVLLDSSSVGWLAPGSEFHMRARGPARWLSLMIPAISISPQLAEDARWRSTWAAHISPGVMQSLLGACRLALHTEANGQVNNADVAVALSNRLVDACVDVMHGMLAVSHVRHGRRAISRQTTLRDVLALIEARLDTAIHLAELCGAAGVSERTLINMFKEQLQVSPHQYIISRRLHGAHAAIRSAGKGTTVSDICAQHGIWDFGRFARAYRELFGCYPSQALDARRAGI